MADERSEIVGTEPARGYCTPLSERSRSGWIPNQTGMPCGGPRVSPMRARRSLSRPGGLTRSAMLSAIMLLAGMPVMAQPVRTTATYPDSIQVRRDLALEQAARTRARTLAASLRPEARAKLDLAARAVLAALESGRGNSDPDPLVRREVRSRFGRLSTEQADLFSLYVLARVAGYLSNPEDLSGNGSDGISETTALRLQGMMDRRSKFMSTLSNLMKKTSDTQKSVIQNLK